MENILPERRAVKDDEDVDDDEVRNLVDLGGDDLDASTGKSPTRQRLSRHCKSPTVPHAKSSTPRKALKGRSRISSSNSWNLFGFGFKDRQGQK